MSNMTPEQQSAKKYPWLMNETVGNAKIEHKREAYADCIRERVEPLEEENVRLRALVQELVDALNGSDGVNKRLYDFSATGLVRQSNLTALSAAKELGFVPTNTTEG